MKSEKERGGEREWREEMPRECVREGGAGGSMECRRVWGGIK